MASEAPSDLGDLDVTLVSEASPKQASPYMASVSLPPQQQPDSSPNFQPPSATPHTSFAASHPAEDVDEDPPPPPSDSDEEVTHQADADGPVGASDHLSATAASAQGSFRSLQERTSGLASARTNDGELRKSGADSSRGTPSEKADESVGAKPTTPSLVAQSLPPPTPPPCNQTPKAPSLASLSQQGEKFAHPDTASEAASERSVPSSVHRHESVSMAEHVPSLHESRRSSRPQSRSEALPSATPASLAISGPGGHDARSSRHSFASRGSAAPEHAVPQSSHGGRPSEKAVSEGVPSRASFHGSATPSQPSHGRSLAGGSNDEHSESRQSRVSAPRSTGWTAPEKQLPYVHPYVENFSTSTVPEELKSGSVQPDEVTHPVEEHAEAKRLPVGYDSQPHPPANSVHEPTSYSFSGQRSSPTFSSAALGPQQRSAVPPPATAQPVPPPAAPIVTRAITSCEPRRKTKPTPNATKSHPQSSRQQVQRDPVLEAACAMWDAKLEEMSQKQTAVQEESRIGDANRTRKLQVRGEVRQLQENERRDQFHAREHYPTRRFEVNIGSPPYHAVHSLSTTESFRRYKDTYGVQPASADVVKETVASPDSTRRSCSPMRRSRSRDPSPNSPHGMRTLTQTQAMLQRSRLQPDSENSLDAVARLKRLKKLSCVSSGTASLLACPRSTTSTKHPNFLNPRHPEWRVGPDGTFMLPDGTVGNVLEHLHRFRR
eukprot:TRINITY_DN32644_c0_g1_i1.p1 TRINITY_DN32644_c0_g1~~TRINITY_DN32644_c0_g1_i1.p1  ORF type:complete len:733 (+),score=50.63 TRINITY_DN32644_c0_g1_i1:43-2199(+)